MAKKKQEDNRDVFDKALDFLDRNPGVPTIAGAIAGGTAGNLIGRRMKKYNLPNKGKGWVVRDETIGGAAALGLTAPAGVRYAKEQREKRRK